MYMYCEFCKKDIHKHHVDRHLKSKQHLKASGIVDSIKGMFNNIKTRFSKRLDGFNNTSTKCLNDYGNQIIKSLTIARKPIHSFLDKFINAISLGKYQELKNTYGYDKFFHLCLIATLANDVKVYIEKVDAVTISTKDSMSGSDTEYLNIPMTKAMTLNQFIDDARKLVNNDKLFFDYNAFGNGTTEPGNCQVFVSYLLKSIGKYGKPQQSFVYQDIKKLAEQMPQSSKSIVNKITDLGQIANRLLGKGKFKIHAVKLSKSMSKADALKHAQNIARSNKNLLYKELKNYHSFRVKPKTKFIPKTFRYKKINPFIKIVLGELKSP